MYSHTHSTHSWRSHSILVPRAPQGPGEKQAMLEAQRAELFASVKQGALGLRMLELDNV